MKQKHQTVDIYIVSITPFSQYIVNY